MAIENELPHYTADAAHALEAARLTIAAQQAELARVQEHWQQAEAHNNDLNNDLVKLRRWCTDELTEARKQGQAATAVNQAYWQGKETAFVTLWERIKPVV